MGPAHAQVGKQPLMGGRKRKRQAVALALSLACHGLGALALLSLRPPTPVPPEPPPILVTLTPAPDPAPAPPSPQPTRAAQALASAAPSSPKRKPAPSHAPARHPLPRPAVTRQAAAKARAAGDEAAQGTSVGLSDADVAGAAMAGSGSGGGVCDMAALLQGKLRGDPLVHAAMADAHLVGGRNLMVWNGDWVRTGGEDGKGLAAVREAIMWEIAFAPEACRRQSVRGLVLLSLDQARGSARLVLGSGVWRWGDLLETSEASARNAPAAADR